MGRRCHQANFPFLVVQEREGDWPLHLEAVEAMLPLFYAADHINYARDGLYYLKSMKSLPKNVCDHFMKGEHTIQHRAGVFSGIWSDMGIETSYMRFSHSSSSGLVGLEMKPETMKTWAYSLNSCCEIIEGLETMRSKAPCETEFHKGDEKPYQKRRN